MQHPPLHAHSSAAPFRQIRLGSHEVRWERRADGCLLIRSKEDLQAYPRKLTDRLGAVAQQAPDRVFLAVRRPDGSGWHPLTYAEAWSRVQRIAQGLLDMRLPAGRPIALLSGSSIDHALLALAAMHVGIPCSAITPAYSLLSDDHSKLRHVMGLLNPSMVYADEGEAYAAAIDRTAPGDARIVHTRAPAAGGRSLPFEALMQREATADVQATSAAVDADAVAKVLFTSGSTGMPKGVINTHRMLASNQQMFVQSIPCIAEEPPVILSWLPWHHTSGGNQMMGLTLHCGGTLYIDDGKPVPGEIEKTVRNLREIAPTIYFSVPRGFAMLVPWLRRDAELRARFFSRLSLMYYSGSALGRSLVQDLDDIAVQACGQRVPMMSGYGATETAPFALAANWLTQRTGLAGLPVPGCDLKLYPIGSGKYEGRLRGPNVTPGYWGQPDLTRKLFDEEGYACLGDALSLIDPDDPAAGLAFDGRVAEDFKLSTGTWVNVGTLRARLIQESDGLFLDAVICGEGRDAVGAFIIADPAACAAACGLDAGASWDSVITHAALRSSVAAIIDSMARRNTGSSTFVSRAMLVRAQPSAAAGELTDKGSINQRAFLANRQPLVDELFAPDPPAHVVVSALGTPV